MPEFVYMQYLCAPHKMRSQATVHTTVDTDNRKQRNKMRLRYYDMIAITIINQARITILRSPYLLLSTSNPFQFFFFSSLLLALCAWTFLPFTMAEKAIEFWRSLDLVSLQKDLDKDAEEMGRRREGERKKENWFIANKFNGKKENTRKTRKKEGILEDRRPMYMHAREGENMRMCMYMGLWSEYSL